MNCTVCHLAGTEEHFTNFPSATKSVINIFLNPLFSMKYDRSSTTIFSSALLNIWCRYKVHIPTNALFIKLDKILKFTLKITLTCSYMFRSTTTIREPSLEPS